VPILANDTKTITYRRYIKLYKKIIKFIWSNKKSALIPLTESEYKDQLIDIEPEKAKLAFEKSWEIRNFEIEMYWKRATYFWAFIASTFVGYLALINSDSYSRPDEYNHVEVYFLLCIGLILSFAWHLTNLGSKSWQRHWEVHIDLLEDKFTGPLYKTVFPYQTFSVSKINETVSFTFISIWLLLGAKYLLDQDLIRKTGEDYTINWFVTISSTLTVFVILSMLKGHGRGRFGSRPITMYRRQVHYRNNAD
jgi:hypothetical protein